MNYSASDIKKDRDFSRSKEAARELSETYDIDLVRLFELVSEKDILIPASVFTKELSALETISRYLHENIGMGFRRIAVLMNRSEKTIWQAYNHSLRKYQKKLAVSGTRYLIPLSVFSDRTYSNLEAIVLFIKTRYDLKFSEIAGILHRDQRTVWTVYRRARMKRAR
jgi:predicted DNA-binding protein (UPF0251 family)